MDLDLFWKSITLFNFLFIVLWTIFYTYQPSFMAHTDFVAPGSNVRGSEADNTKSRSDKYLSDAGRSLVFLSSLLSALITVILFVVGIKYFTTRKMIKCDKDAKGLKKCKIVKV